MEAAILCFLTNTAKVANLFMYKVTPLSLSHAEQLLDTRRNFNWINGRAVFINFDDFSLTKYNEYNDTNLTVNEVYEKVKDYKKFKI